MVSPHVQAQSRVKQSLCFCSSVSLSVCRVKKQKQKTLTLKSEKVKCCTKQEHYNFNVYLTEMKQVLFTPFCAFSYLLLALSTIYFVINSSDTAHNNADPAHMLITEVTYILQYLVAQLCYKQKPPCVEVIKAALM